MRHALAATALVSVLLSAAACSTSSPTASPSPSSAPASSPTAAGKDRAATCAEFETVSKAAGMKMLQAMGDGFGTIGETDKAKVEAVKTKMVADLKAALTDFRAAAETASAETTDPELKAQFEIIKTELGKFEADLANVTTATDLANMPELESAAADAANKKIKDLCKI